MRVGIVGVGTIGQALARAIDRGEVAVQLTALHSRNLAQAQAFARTLGRVPEVVDLAGVITRCDLVIEAATQAALTAMAPDILTAGKDLMVLSVGALLDHPEWPALAACHGCRLYVPSGAIVGLDGLKGACVGRVDTVAITTRKPPQGLAGAPYVEAHGIDVYACGPWSQGPLVPMTLNLLEGYDVASMGPGSLAFLHRYTEAFKLAAADREGFFGDPDQVDVPIRGLLDKRYADERRRSIRDDRAWPELPEPGDPWRYEGRSGPLGYRPRVASGVGAPDTSYCCAMDAEGNAFSATPSDPGLGAPLVEGLGIIVSTRGAQLWTTPGHPSAIAPRKRPRLTPNPALLMRDGRALMPFGCPGEDAQCQAMVQTVCNVVDFGMNLQAAIEAPRVISRSFPWTFFPHAYEPGVLCVEGRVAREVRDALAARGHVIRDWPDMTPGAAGVCAIRELEPGTLEGGADPRRESYAIGW